MYLHSVKGYVGEMTAATAGAAETSGSSQGGKDGGGASADAVLGVIGGVLGVVGQIAGPILGSIFSDKPGKKEIQAAKVAQMRQGADAQIAALNQEAQMQSILVGAGALGLILISYAIVKEN